MNSQPEDEMLPVELRDALAGLPREREPSALLEERTVRALRAQGLLAAKPSRRIRFPRVWMAAAAAACVALFASGVAMGQWLAMRESREVIAQVQAQNARQAALMVQQTGSAYVSALARLQQVADTTNPVQRKQGRDVAVQALRAAANELVRLAPDDPVSSGILAAFDREQAAQKTPRDSTARQTEVVWY
jgi:hypothetical protein